MIKVITFDLDGVYFPNGKANFINSVVGLGVSEEDVRRVFLKSSQMNEEYKRGLMGDEKFWSWAASEWGLDMKWEELVELLIESYDVDSSIVEIIKKLRGKGYKTAICTSNFPARINGLQKRFGFLDNFDVKVISFEVGVNKPDKELFKRLIELSEVSPSEIVYADDHLESVSNANELGIKTYLYDGFENYLAFLNSQGVDI